jgi:hypothetical protein
MISYPELGKIGRLGNHLFQMAATIGVALDHGDSWGFPRWEHEREFPISGCFHASVPEGPEYREKRFAYDPIPYQPGLRLHGYFQSEKYFERHSEVVRKLFTPRGVPPKSDFGHVASLQVRRGDYLPIQDRHPILSMDYYEKAMEVLQAQGIKKFIVLSDDLEWCRVNFTQPGVAVVPPMDPIAQFKLTLACRHHVMANSTFSWWTAWLDPDPGKIVIAPRQWFGPTHACFKTTDLYARNWWVM